MKILVTGFDPFGGEPINPALEAVKGLADTINGAEIIKLEIPTVFGKSAEVVKAAMEKHHPDVVLNIGQAGGRFAISPERVAINIDDARIPDNEGNQPVDIAIQEDGAPAYFTQLPIKAMVTQMKEAGIPANVSNTAGTFVCNHIMYQVQYLIEKEYPAVKGGFIHVPYIPEQVIEKAGQPFMSLTDMTKGLTAAIEAIILYDGKEDLKAVGGAIH
ncbi:pyroglutamyl-peptidase I [Carnobacterium divergens]|uniref:Pyrrolidone-carboxylate peptidase n=2 Tax=Carnobacterium divergens TaxID=2748 RepID=A0A0R2HW57_CARDV|nr:pyroglutamyl-peptidase I [Carnobacterium divergens]ANZ98989.1 pyroglutamyl-peptidase I [Carnobacterium divergens]KRN56914.1 pyrrolidone-carboxylate peptidase [Carnobacterium divergens DSM 20623]MDO0874864.1 pyroglutamyl-peptidase I [Carnobacterium divergens]MDT1958489.1 pyroglutamyl-peptidase I [Carnobacterium divergens]MDT1974457.1 pyroglutamyl-peptidase I [Carnobacterium divergens]